MALEKKHTERIDLSDPETKLRELKKYMFEKFGITEGNIDEALDEQQERLQKKIDTYNEVKDYPIMNCVIGERWIKGGRL